MGVSIETDEHEQKQENPFEIANAQPGFTYRGLNKNARNIGRKIAKGWKIITGDDPEKYVSSDVTPMKKGEGTDSTQQISDVVLAKIPSELYEAGRAMVRKKTARLAAMIIRDYDKDVGKLGLNPKRDPTGNATKYATGVTQTGWDKSNLKDKEFEEKYGMPKGDVEE